MTGDGEIAARFAGPLGSFALAAEFRVPARGVTALFGPSGCGKTTVLRCVAGLRRIADGSLSVAGKTWQDARTFLPTHRRPIGYVFQEASLFPHLSVRGNLDYGRGRALKAGRAERLDFAEVAALLGIAHLLDRAPTHLSGGERQRVAIGRALLSQPELLLMDEPLSALDRVSRDDILPYLERLRDRLAIPVLYVSHDLAEVERLADTLVLMRDGRVEASGPVDQLQADPTLPIAKLPEAGVTLRARVTGQDAAYGLSRLDIGGAGLLVPGLLGDEGTRVRIRITASDVSLARSAAEGSTILNILPARIIGHAARDPFQTMVVLTLGTEGRGPRILARVTRRSWESLGLAPGQTVFAQIKGVALVTGRTG